jgi:hypothetical protein
VHIFAGGVGVGGGVALHVLVHLSLGGVEGDGQGREGGA